jgi:predicted nucleic acid-binding protein
MAIPSCLVDTNILLRMTRRSDPQHQVVDAALARPAGQAQSFTTRTRMSTELKRLLTAISSESRAGKRESARTGGGAGRVQPKDQIKQTALANEKVGVALAGKQVAKIIIASK